MGPTKEEVLTAMANRVGSADPSELSFDEGVQVMLDDIARSEIITTEDLAIRINARD